MISQEDQMRHYEFCVDLMDDDDGADADSSDARFGAVSCAACTEVNFSTSIFLFPNLSHPIKQSRSQYVGPSLRQPVLSAWYCSCCQPQP